MKLISMTNFVLENTSRKFEDYENKNLLFKIRGYARFLKQPLKLEMFIAEKPEPSVDSYMQPREMQKQYNEWFQEYGRKILFEGFELSTNSEGEKMVVGDYTCLKVSDLENGTIEDLTKYVSIKLTNQAIDRNFGQACY